MNDEILDDQEGTAKTSATLVLLRGGQPSGETFPIGERAVIGRFDPAVGPVDVDLGPTPEGVYVSRKHAEVWFEDGKWKLRDLGSSNGTFVLVPGEDFRRIEEDTELTPGQQVSFGNARFMFEVGTTPATDAAEESGDATDPEPEATAEESTETDNPQP